MKKRKIEKELADLKSRFRALESYQEIFASDLLSAEGRISELECPHENIEFVRVGLPVQSAKKCRDCDKILKVYDTDFAFRRAQAEYHRQKANEFEN